MRERTLLIRPYQLGHDSTTDEGSSNEPKLVLEDLEDHLSDTTSKRRWNTRTPNSQEQGLETIDSKLDLLSSVPPLK